MDFSTLPPDLARNRVLRTADAAAFCGLDIQLFRKLVSAGTAPAPVRLSERVKGFRIGELSDFIERLAADRAVV